MNKISLSYLRFKSYILDNTSLKQSVFLGLAAVLLFVVSSVVANRTVDICCGLLSGFAFGIFLIKLQPIVNYFKGKPAQGTN